MIELVTAYQFYLTVHILAAVVWVGGATITQVYAARAMADPSPERLAGFARDAAFVGKTMFTPASLVLVVFGFLLVNEGNWSLGSTWLIFALAVFAASFVEFVEALTIVLAMGMTRGWKSAWAGTAVAVVALAVFTTIAGYALATWLPRQDWKPVLRIVAKAPNAWFDMAQRVRKSVDAVLACELDRAEQFVCGGGVNLD